MVIGPIFRAELLRTARRGRYYVLRFVYGTILLLLVWGRYEATFWGDSTATIAAVAQFAERTFAIFAIVQLVTVLLLVPPLFGGTIADEKQRKTLHYLMASRLSGGEIVVDKVLGRVPHLMVFVAMGLPMVSILGLFGGIPADEVVIAFVGTFSTAAFAVALSVLVSTLARRVRQAVLTAYVLMLSWLFVPPLMELFGTVFVPAAYAWLRPINSWLADSSPVGIWSRAVFSLAGPGLRRPSLMAEFVGMVELQFGGMALLLLLAVWRLRPTFRRQEETPARWHWFGTRGTPPWQWLARPDCGDDAVLWKECHFAPTDIFTKMVVLPAIVIVTVPLALLTEVDGKFSRVLLNLWHYGSDAGRFVPDEFVRVNLGWYTAFWLLAVAGASASSVTIERETDTWVILTSTPLTGWEIVWGKLMGAVWNQRGFGAVLVFFWSLALVTRAVHPLGVLISAAVVGVLTWFVAALGAYASLRSQNTSRALTGTLLVLGVFNAYPVILVLWFLGALRWESSFTLLGAMPSLAAGPLAWPRSITQTWGRGSAAIYVAFGLGFLAIYAGPAACLTLRIVERFDDWLDRPHWLGRRAHRQESDPRHAAS